MLYDAFMMLYVWHILTPKKTSSYTKTDTYLDWDSIPTEANFYASLGCAHGIVGLLAERGRPGKHQGPRSFWPRWCWSPMIYLTKIAKSSDWWIFWVAILADTNIPRYQHTKIQDTRLARWVAACGMSQWLSGLAGHHLSRWSLSHIHRGWPFATDMLMFTIVLVTTGFW